MLFKIFYQENKNSTPRRENTKTMYMDIDADNARDGVIKVRDLITTKTNYRIEYIDALSKASDQYEKDTTGYALTEL